MLYNGVLLLIVLVTVEKEVAAAVFCVANNNRSQLPF